VTPAIAAGNGVRIRLRRFVGEMVWRQMLLLLDELSSYTTASYPNHSG
jgi:hypothetical protein